MDGGQEAFSLKAEMLFVSLKNKGGRPVLRQPPDTNLKLRSDGLEPSQAYAHYPLKVACLPISPRPLYYIFVYSL